MRAPLRSFGPGLWMLACASGCGSGTADADDDSVGASSKADELDGGSTTEDGAAEVQCRAASDAFDVVWPAGGPDCDTEADLFLHAYDDDTFILRQSLCTSFEAPFIHLLFGQDRVLVEDSGAGNVAVFDAVRTVVDQWLEAQGRAGDDAYEMLLVNSHAHGDHVAGNEDFAGRPGVTVVGFGVDAVSDFFDLTWPQDTAEIDLGGRVVDLIPIPGHEASHIALYDRREGLLLTGDAFYPGRLFIDDFDTYVASNDRLVAWAEQHPVCWVLGTHIEMSNTPGVDFEFGRDHHPDEHVLQLTPDHLREAAEALHAMAGVPRQEAHDDFIIFPL
jgi:glyoxylase-like metal-dependent hydrolase (beta-lactamase superfamily II)